jgi:glucuronate isomerase
MENLGPIHNTIQYAWFVEMARRLLDFRAGDHGDNWETMYDLAAEKDGRAGLGTAGLAKEQAVGCLPDERFRRPSRASTRDSISPACARMTWSSTWPSPKCAQRLEAATNQDVTSVGRLRGSLGPVIPALHPP